MSEEPEPAPSEAAEPGQFDRIVVLTVEGLGIGAPSDAEADERRGANTLAHVASYAGGLDLTLLPWLGLGNLQPVRGVEPTDPPAASLARLGRAGAGAEPGGAVQEMLGEAVPVLREAGLAVEGLGPAVGWTDGVVDDVGDRRDREGPEERAVGWLQRNRRGVLVAGLATGAREGGPIAVARSVRGLDRALPPLLDALDERSMLLIIGTGGADPILASGGAPTRELVPLLAYTPAVPSGVDLGRAEGLDAIGATLVENFGLEGNGRQRSLYQELLA